MTSRSLSSRTHDLLGSVLGIGAVASVLVLNPDILEILPHFFWVKNPGYPEWVTTDFSNVASTPVPLIMLGYLGTLAITLITIPGYLAWIKHKRWGIFRGTDDPTGFSRRLFERFKNAGTITYLPSAEAERKKARTLLKPVLVDLGIAFVLVSVISAAYMIAGAELLGPQDDGTYLLPRDVDLLTEQARIFTSMAAWLEPLYQISVFFALFGTVYAGFEAVSRMLYETWGGLSLTVRALPYKRFMKHFLLYVLATGIPLAIAGHYGVSILLMLSLTLLFIGVVGVVIFGIGIIHLSRTLLPDGYRLGTTGTVAGVVALLLMCLPVLFFFV